MKNFFTLAVAMKRVENEIFEKRWVKIMIFILVKYFGEKFNIKFIIFEIFQIFKNNSPYEN